MNPDGSCDWGKAKEYDLSVSLIPVFFIRGMDIPLMGSGVVFDNK